MEKKISARPDKHKNKKYQVGKNVFCVSAQIHMNILKAYSNPPKLKYINTAAHAGTHTQYVHGSRDDSLCNTVTECKTIELLYTFA